ncbi:MAG: MFS transporter [Planctomycetaceae bacterium]|nr:MFS transporter [Planctomycetaceae bacterium]
MKLFDSSLSWWRWWVAVMLLMATMINYMDRQTLSTLSVRITNQFKLSEEQYGELEFVFGVAFALGSLVFGALADKVPVRLLYPAVLLAWSVMGFLTGLTTGFNNLWYCRGLLGFFEAGHWPCALVVTHAVLTRGDRVFGNSILQSGASIGAIITPFIVMALAGDPKIDDGWRPPFLVIGAVGIIWVVLWFTTIPPSGLTNPTSTETKSSSSFSLQWLFDFFKDPKFWALAFVVLSINTSWQLIRAWLPKFLQQGRGYSENETLAFTSLYYVFTDVGCLLAGAAVLTMSRSGINVHRSRLIVFTVCAVVCTLTIAASMLPKGFLLLGTLLIIGSATLGLFPCYYSFSQELNVKHIGKASGVLSAIGWLVSAPTHKWFGRLADQSKSYDVGIMLVGLAPLIGVLAMWILWRKDKSTNADLTN